MSVPERIKPLHPARRVLEEVGVAAHGCQELTPAMCQKAQDQPRGQATKSEHPGCDGLSPEMSCRNASCGVSVAEQKMSVSKRTSV